jgi:aminoglycoside phosphotransferase (APT) family kinase protein
LESPHAGELASALKGSLGPVTVEGLTRLSGGASRETWRLDAVAGDGTRHRLILRRDPPGRPSRPGGMALEALSIRAASAAGLRVPEVLVHSEAPSPWETAGMVMRVVDGEALARRILRDDEFAVARERLTADCAEFLAGLHAIDPSDVPGLPSDDPVDSLRAALSSTGDEPFPTFELAFRWLDANRPPGRPHVIVHGDFRLGNLLVDSHGLAAALDWELVHLGDPSEDLGWFCTKAWRFGSRLPAGGVGTREELLESYRAAGGTDITLDELRWWEVLTTLRWGVMCVGQAAAHTSGLVRSVELAAIGRRVCEQEWDLLLLLAPDAAAAALAAAPSVVTTATPSLHGRPTSAELLEAVEEFLRNDVMPAASGRTSFHARVAANVVAMVAREMAATPGEAERREAQLAPLGVTSEAELGAGIAEGRFDGDADALHAALAAGVVAKVAVANPKYLMQR